MKNAFTKLHCAVKKKYVIMVVMVAAIFAAILLGIRTSGQMLHGPTRQSNHATSASETAGLECGAKVSVQVKQADASDSSYANQVAMAPGKQYELIIHYGVGINDQTTSHGIYAKVNIPLVIKRDSTGTKATGYIGGNSSFQNAAWGSVTLANPTEGDMVLRYVPNSAVIHNSGKMDGRTLSENIITTGIPLGYDSLDGIIPKNDQSAGNVTLRIQADQPNFMITQQIRTRGTMKWKSGINASQGGGVDFLLAYANTGTTEQDNVVLKDILPSGMVYVPHSTVGINSNFPKGKSISDDITKKGINIGNYSPKSNAFVEFSAKIDANASLLPGRQLTNLVLAETDNGTKKATILISLQ